jgi:hypothetical protein
MVGTVEEGMAGKVGVMVADAATDVVRLAAIISREINSECNNSPSNYTNGATVMMVQNGEMIVETIAVAIAERTVVTTMAVVEKTMVVRVADLLAALAVIKGAMSSAQAVSKTMAATTTMIDLQAEVVMAATSTMIAHPGATAVKEAMIDPAVAMDATTMTTVPQAAREATVDSKIGMVPPASHTLDPSQAKNPLPITRRHLGTMVHTVQDSQAVVDMEVVVPTLMMMRF